MSGSDFHSRITHLADIGGKKDLSITSARFVVLFGLIILRFFPPVGEISNLFPYHVLYYLLYHFKFFLL
jgi:hypothetical protein